MHAAKARFRCCRDESRRSVADLRRLDEAEASLLAAVALDPGLAVAHRTLGDVYRIQGQPDQALVALDRATTLDPLDAEAHMIYGHTLFDKSRFVDAVACYDRALAPQS